MSQIIFVASLALRLLLVVYHSWAAQFHIRREYNLSKPVSLMTEAKLGISRPDRWVQKWASEQNL